MFTAQWNKNIKTHTELEHVFTSIKGQSGRGGLTLNFTLACQNRLERGGLPCPGPAIPIFPGAPHNSIIFHQPLVPLWLSARKRKQTVRMIHDPASRCLHNSVTYWEKKGENKQRNHSTPFTFRQFLKCLRVVGLDFQSPNVCSSQSVFCQGLYFQYWRDRVREACDV